jgi:hypothetical protein
MSYFYSSAFHNKFIQLAYIFCSVVWAWSDSKVLPAAIYYGGLNSYSWMIKFNNSEMKISYTEDSVSLR